MDLKDKQINSMYKKLFKEKTIANAKDKELISPRNSQGQIHDFSTLPIHFTLVIYLVNLFHLLYLKKQLNSTGNNTTIQTQISQNRAKMLNLRSDNKNLRSEIKDLHQQIKSLL